MGSRADDIVSDSTLLLLREQQQEVLERMGAWKSDQDAFIQECRTVLSGLEDCLENILARRIGCARSASGSGPAVAPDSGGPDAAFVDESPDIEYVGLIEQPPGEPPKLRVTASEHITNLVNFQTGPVFVGERGMSPVSSLSPSHFRPSYYFVNDGDGRRASTPSMFSMASTSAGLSSKPSTPAFWSDDGFSLPNAYPSSDEDLCYMGCAIGESIRGGSPAEAWEPMPNSPSLSTERLSRRDSTSKISLKRGVRRTDKQVRRADQCIIASKREELEVQQGRIRRVANGRAFEAFITVAIILNTLFIGLQTQWLATEAEQSFYAGTTHVESTPLIFTTTQIVFSLTFAFDVGLRWAADGILGFITGTEWAWNAFDIFTVIVGSLQIIFEWCRYDSVLTSVSVVRVLRVLRLVRVVRMIRTYTFFRELRMMVESCLNGLKSYMWCCLVILLLLYVFGIVFTTHTYLFISMEAPSSGDAHIVALQKSFGTLDKSMLSLFQAITGGRDWIEFYDEVGVLGLKDRALLCIFLSFSVLAVMNAVAAVFVESTMQSSQHDRELLIKEQILGAEKYQIQMMEIFEEMDTDGTNTISLDEFIAHLDDDRVRAYFETLKLDVTDAGALFTLLDTDHSGTLQIDEFIQGCQMLKGEARALDMRFMRFEVHALRRDVMQLQAFLQGKK